jgi:serine/threonine protein kinase
MAIVYRAFDDRLRRPVATKVLADKSLGEGKRGQRILEEARAASALNHPAITTIYDVGEDGGLVFIVMELVERRNLRSLLNGPRLEFDTIVRIGAEIAGALAAAHAHGIVHGDVKPENVMVRADGRVKLLDFGTRQLSASDDAPTGVLDATSEQTAMHTVGPSGTLPYMAPELLNGGPADGRTDLFALGVLLYEAVARRRPFEAPSSPELIEQIVRVSPAALDHPNC